MSGPYSEKKSGGAPHPKGTGRVSRQAEKSPAGAEKPANIVEAGDPAANSGHDEAVRGMFGRIVRFYDFLNHFLSFGIDRKWRKVLAASIKSGPNGRILDLAAGTLDVALAIARAQPQVMIPAMDFCQPMLEQGAKKLSGNLASRIIPVTADSKRLPLPDNCVDSVTMAFGIRNISPRAEAFAEMLRVLAPGGRACILEFGSGREKIMGGLYNFYLNNILPVVGRAFARDKTAYAYLAQTIDNFPPAGDLAAEMRAAGFANVAWRRLTCGIVCLHVGEKPEKSLAGA